MRPSSSRVYNRTCTILSNHYDNPKTRAKNADLLCKRSSLRDFDRPPFLLWFGCVLNCSRVSYVRLINQCGLYVDKIKISLKFSGCGLYTGTLNRPKMTVVRELWFYVTDSVTKAVSDADRKRISELEETELALKQEISKLKV